MTEEEAVERIKLAFPKCSVLNSSGWITDYDANGQILNHFYAYSFYLVLWDYSWGFLIKIPLSMKVLDICIKDAQQAFNRIAPYFHKTGAKNER